MNDLYDMNGTEGKERRRAFTRDHSRFGTSNNPDFEVVFVRHAGKVSKLTFMVMIMEFEKLVCTNYRCSIRVRNMFNGITVQVST